MKEKGEMLRDIPQVEKLLQQAELKPFIESLGRGIVVRIARDVTERCRRRILSGGESSGGDALSGTVIACRQKMKDRLQRVINCSGIIIHTNLGRSPLGPDILGRMAASLSGYCNLEFHIPTQGRGRRGGFAEELICDLTGAEDALIVNNNASSVFLILSEFGRGWEVIVSRGELIQIGGGFRIPDIMEQTGARLVEVGTTNITMLEDFRKAITVNTGMIFSAHQSNYRITGFSASPSLKDLASLRSEGVMLVRDLGSGNFAEGSFAGVRSEPTVASELREGADLVCFSGDKLLGSCQAGIITGSKEYIARLRKNPLMRMLRVDKMTYFILQESLLFYENSTHESLPLWKTISQDGKSLSRKRAALVRRLKNPEARRFIGNIATMAAFGGGSMPGVEIPSLGIGIDMPGVKPDDIYSFFLDRDVPVLGLVSGDRFILDMMTVLEDDIPLLAGAIDELISEKVK
jgi:L-seryl-tRNA(Ser) seleniumtransferase